METIYYNGNIITMENEDEPEAVIVNDGVITFVGNLIEAKKNIGIGARSIDLRGQCLMPSFIDSHSHICMNGQMSLCAWLGDCETYDDIISTLREHMGTEGFIIGFGYDHNFLKENGQPDKRILDQVSVDIPIIILHVSAHLACVNSKMLKIAGITEETPDPQGGKIGRFEDGKHPSGYLEEAGMIFVQQYMAQWINRNISEISYGMQSNYIKNGVTTVQDGATTENDFNVLKKLSEAGKLKIDVVVYPLMTANGVELLHKNQSMCRKYKNNIKIGGYKMVLDGSPQGRTAWMSRPYLNGEDNYSGYPWMKNEQVEKFVKIAVTEKHQILAHCNGDAASEQYLCAYEHILKETNCTEDLRPVMIHCQTVRSDQLERMARLNMIASIFVGHVFYWGDVHMKNLGLERGNRISPVRDALDHDVKVNFHQDTPVTQPNMMHSVWCAVNRISRKGKVIGPEQKASVYEALKAITIDAAYEYFEEDSKGSIKIGKRADLVILDQSPLNVDPFNIKDIKVMKTIKDGKVIYECS